jgi:CIC family chloride channel protein
MSVQSDAGGSFLDRLSDEPLVRRAKIALAGLRRTLRATEFGQIVVCGVLGAMTGAGIAILRELVVWMHRQAFALPLREYLSTGIGVSPFRIMVVPVLGGLLLGLFRRTVKRQSSTDLVDPIEANALFGGRLSFRDSVRVTLTTLWSNGAGASLGMEAGYTQIGSGFFSTVGQYFRLRRNDLRVYVTAGSGAAIAAAFNAPIAGAFYGFELIQGGYTPRALAPVAVACVCASLVQRAMTQMPVLFEITGGLPMKPASYYIFAVMGVIAAGIGILTMRCVTWSERLLRQAEVPEWLRPAAGGILLSAIALWFPQVLGSGHGAIQYHFDYQLPWLLLAFLLMAKMLASAISVGSGFRGGLFSSSLFIGALFGGLFVQLAALVLPSMAAERSAFLLAGMGSVGAAIVGAPLTMVFLTLEATGDYQVTLGVLVSVIIASLIVRLTFGYSFATWRFHLRGLGIQGATDVGWITELTVGRLMRSDPKIVTNDMSLKALRELYPPGSAKLVYVVDRTGQFTGCIDTMEAHSPELDDALPGLVAGDLAQLADIYLLPSDDLPTAFQRFDKTQLETLPVLASASDRRPVGYVTEAYALRRYTQELEQVRANETGSDLYSLGQTSQK